MNCPLGWSWGSAFPALRLNILFKVQCGHRLNSPYGSTAPYSRWSWKSLNVLWPQKFTAYALSCESSCQEFGETELIITFKTCYRDSLCSESSFKLFWSNWAQAKVWREQLGEGSSAAFLCKTKAWRNGGTETYFRSWTCNSEKCFAAICFGVVCSMQWVDSRALLWKFMFR